MSDRKTRIRQLLLEAEPGWIRAVVNDGAGPPPLAWGLVGAGVALVAMGFLFDYGPALVRLVLFAAGALAFLFALRLWKPYW